MDAAFDPHTAIGGGFVRYRVDGALRYGLVIPRAGAFHRGRWSASAILYEADADAPAIMPRPSTAPDPHFRMRAEVELIDDADEAARASADARASWEDAAAAVAASRHTARIAGDDDIFTVAVRDTAKHALIVVEGGPLPRGTVLRAAAGTASRLASATTALTVDAILPPSPAHAERASDTVRLEIFPRTGGNAGAV